MDQHRLKLAGGMLLLLTLTHRVSMVVAVHISRKLLQAFASTELLGCIYSQTRN